MNNNDIEFIKKRHPTELAATKEKKSSILENRANL
jgi:hypothetical protein